MAEISEAAIEKRAKALAEQDGFTWDVYWNPPQGPYAKIGAGARLTFLQPDDPRIQLYRDRARAKLCKDAGNA
jgi:hypothetical protein